MKDDILVCLPVTGEFNWPQSHHRNCELCGGKIWVHDKSPSDISYLCMECFSDWTREGHDYEVIPPTPEQLKELFG